MGRRTGFHLVAVVLGIGLVLLASVLPYLPGRHDPVAATISFLAQLLGIVGLALVPVGLVWLLGTRRRRRVGSAGDAHQAAYLWIALVVSGLVAAVLVLAGFAWSVTVGTALLLLAGTALVMATRQLRVSAREQVDPGLLPVALAVTPLVVLALQLLVMPRAVELSRTAVMDNAGELVDALEDYHRRTGTYPESLLAVHPDFLPGVVGVERYRYERAGASYNLAFEQVLFHPLGTREIVVFNPLDQQTAKSHALWRLTDPELDGWYEVVDAGRPQWKRFRFD